MGKGDGSFAVDVLVGEVTYGKLAWFPSLARFSPDRLAGSMVDTRELQEKVGSKAIFLFLLFFLIFIFLNLFIYIYFWLCWVFVSV